MPPASNKFNVIVPTRERPATLPHCLRTLVAQDYENLRIIVSDNFSQDNTRDIVSSISDERLVYVNTGKRVGMSSNWEFALSHVEDGWVTFLGDDDGLLPGAVTRLNALVEEYPCEAVNSASCIYLWPGGSGAKLAVPTSNGVMYRDAKKILKSVMAGRTPYKELPWLYHGGFATKDMIDRARDKQGTFFRSQMPDVYSGIALSCVSERFLQVGAPLAIAGLSSYSTGGAFQTSSGRSPPRSEEKDPFQQFSSEDNIPFHPKLLFGKSTQILVYESYLQSQFLHHDELSIKLPAQLDIALADAGRDARKEILDQCLRIASLNGIDYSNHSFSSAYRQIDPGAIRFLKRAINVSKRKVLVGKDAAGSNVSEAAVRAGEAFSRTSSHGIHTRVIQNIGEELKRRLLRPSS